jgi:hypothetical protein
VHQKKGRWKIALIAIAAASCFIVGVRVSHLLRPGLAEALSAVFRSAENRGLPLVPSILFALIVVVLLFLWLLPRVHVSRLAGLTDENRFSLENESRKTLAQILGGVFVLVGAYSSIQTFNLSRNGQIADRFTKAIEQLGTMDAAVWKSFQEKLVIVLEIAVIVLIAWEIRISIREEREEIQAFAREQEIWTHMEDSSKATASTLAALQQTTEQMNRAVQEQVALSYEVTLKVQVNVVDNRLEITNEGHTGVTL